MSHRRHELAWRVVPRTGEIRSGDAVLLHAVGERDLLLVLDGLGHGEEAAAVCDAAARTLLELPVAEGVRAVTDALHETLRATRGAAALIAIFDADRLEACCVGNVDLHATGAHLPIVQSPGILGGSLRRLRVFDGRLPLGTRLLAFTDGISTRASLAEVAGLSPEIACEELMRRHRRPHDDASVVVGEVRGT